MSAKADLTLMREEHTADVRTRQTANVAKIRAHLQCGDSGCVCATDSGAVHCPAHEDDNPSLSVGEEGGKVLVHCHRGCEQKEVIDALREQDLWPKATRTEYPIRDEKGKTVATQVIRRDGVGGKEVRWKTSLKGTRADSLPLYGVQHLRKLSPESTPVIVTEGAKAADALKKRGYAAVGTVTGASGTPSKKSLTPLAPFRVLLWPDNDDVGRAHMQRIGRRLEEMDCSDVYVVAWDAPKKGDDADDFEGTDAELEELFEAAEPYEDTGEEDGSGFGHRTDAGNAELYIKLYGDVVRYDHQRKCWLIWKEHWWAPDDDGEVYRLALATAQQRYLNAAEGDPEDRKREADWAIQSENSSRQESTLKVAKNLPPITTNGRDWDLDGWLLGTANGVVNLRTGSIALGQPDEHITMHSPIPYEPDAECPRWEKFLDEVFGGDEEMVDYIWRAMGYSLTADVREQCMFLCYGTGWNGKSVLKGVQEAVLGSYATSTPFSTLEMLHAKGAVPNDVAALAKKRTVTASEINEGRRLNEARLKGIVGGDQVDARFLYGEWFSFRPTMKIWLSVNHKPIVNDDSGGFWRKVRLIPFTENFEGRSDPQLGEKLADEYPGILAWMVRGCLEWQERGLEPPKKVRAATKRYQQESDPLDAFILEWCEVRPDARERGSNLYAAYSRWAEKEGYTRSDRLNPTQFGTRMAVRYKRTRRNSIAYYVGIEVKE